MKLLLGIVLVLAIGTGGFFLWRHWEGQKPADSLNHRATTAEVAFTNIHFAVSAAGDIGPADQVSVRPEVNGRIEQLPVDIGDNVKKGELLCKLDDSDLQIERSQRLKEIEAARLELEKGRRNFERARQLFSDKLIAQEIFDDTKTTFELAQNAVDRADKALNLIEDRLSKTKILAPFDCTVLTRPVSAGQAVSGSGGFNSGTEIMTVANLNDMVVNAHINQADVTRLKTGQEVEIQVESVPGLKMKGVVERIAPQATIKNNIKGFGARIQLKKTDARVRPGMTANLTIPVHFADNVLAVPLAAVFTEQGERYAYVKKDDDFERRTIQIGLTDYLFAEVQSGLNEGEIVSLEQPKAARADKPGKAPVRAGFGAGGSPATIGGNPRPANPPSRRDSSTRAAGAGARS